MLRSSSANFNINICSLSGKSIALSLPAEYCSNDQLITCRNRLCNSMCGSESSQIGNYAKEYRILTLLRSKLHATTYVAWLQEAKQRTRSPLPSGIAGMTLSERTNATILNTLNGVRHNPLLPFLYPLGRTHLSPPLPSGLLVFAFWPPVSTRLGPFCSGLVPFVAPLFRLSQFDCCVVYVGFCLCGHWCICP